MRTVFGRELADAVEGSSAGLPLRHTVQQSSLVRQRPFCAVAERETWQAGEGNTGGAVFFQFGDGHQFLYIHETSVSLRDDVMADAAGGVGGFQRCSLHERITLM